MAAKLGNYRDAHLEIEKIMRQYKRPIYQSAIEEATNVYGNDYYNSAGDLVHRRELTVIEADFAEDTISKRHPHWFADYKAPGGDEEADDVITAAVETPTLTTIGALYRAIGETKAKSILQAHGVDPTKMDRNGKITPGTRAADGKPPVIVDRADNPWSASAWNLTRQGGVIKALGLEKATAIARAAGSKIGATKPTT